MYYEDPEDSAPDRHPPRYRIARGNLAVAPGWMLITNDNVPDVPPLCVPERAGEELIEWSRQLWQKLERAAAHEVDEPISGRFDLTFNQTNKQSSSPAPANKPLRPRASNQIRIPDDIEISYAEPAPLTAGGRWVRIWDPKQMLPLVERHNAGDGSADSGDRVRNAAAWQAQLDAGPWRLCAAPAEPQRAIAELRAELGHLPELCELIEERLQLAQVEGQPFTLPPILLVGPPGVGKSYAARRVADILGLPFELLDMSVQQTNGKLHGADKHWANATPGLLRELVVGGPVANPVIALDELDKTARGGGNARYDPIGPLHAALEPHSARQSQDQCVPGVFDASHVIYIATSNAISSIPSSLLSRFQLVLCGQPGPREALATARRIALEVTSSLRGFGPVNRAVVAAVADRTPREMRQLLERALARAVKAGRVRLELRDLGLESHETGHLH